MPTIPTPVHAVKPPEYFDFDGSDNDREIVIDTSLIELAQSIADNGFLQPVAAIDHGDHGKPLFGFRRIAAHRYGLEQGLPVPAEIPALLYPPSLLGMQRRTIRATENLQRQDLTDPQKYRLCSALMQDNPDWSRAICAAHLRKSPASITMWLSPDEVIEEARQAFLDGKIGFDKVYEIKKARDPARALALALSRSSRSAMREDNRNQRNGDGSGKPSAKLTRVRIPVAAGAARGTAALDLPEGADLPALEKLLKEAKAAISLPQVRMTPPGDDAPGIVTVSRKPIDTQAGTLLDAALESVKDAKGRKLSLATAMAEWQEITKAAQAAAPARLEPDNANAAAPEAAA